MTRLAGFVLVGLAAALIAGVGMSYLASPHPDGLESAVLKSQCADAADADACLEEAAGEAVYSAAPQSLAGYEVRWLSGLLGIMTSFALGTGLLWLAGRKRRERRGRRS